MAEFVSAGAGFLLAVLWFDLMFDVQVLGHAGEPLPEQVLASVAGYYRRVTTTARPMNRLVAATMLATLGCVIAEMARAEHPRWAVWASLALIVAPMTLALAHTVPGAVRLGARGETQVAQSRAARAICRDHLLCIVSIAALLVVQLSAF